MCAFYWVVNCDVLTFNKNNNNAGVQWFSQRRVTQVFGNFWKILFQESKKKAHQWYRMDVVQVVPILRMHSCTIFFFLQALHCRPSSHCLNVIMVQYIKICRIPFVIIDTSGKHDFISNYWQICFTDKYVVLGYKYRFALTSQKLSSTSTWVCF